MSKARKRYVNGRDESEYVENVFLPFPCVTTLECRSLLVLTDCWKLFITWRAVHIAGKHTEPCVYNLVTSVGLTRQKGQWPTRP
jgi:hypothetical protein